MYVFYALFLSGKIFYTYNGKKVKSGHCPTTNEDWFTAILLGDLNPPKVCKGMREVIIRITGNVLYLKQRFWLKNLKEKTSCYHVFLWYFQNQQYQRDNIFFLLGFGKSSFSHGQLVSYSLCGFMLICEKTIESLVVLAKDEITKNIVLRLVGT